jgi:hypothetical protein
LGKSFTETLSLSDPLRTKVELVKVASLIAEFAVDCWDELDTFDLPDPGSLIRLRPGSIDDHIRDVRESLERLTAPTGVPAESNGPARSDEQTPERSIAYCNRSFEYVFLGHFLARRGLTPRLLEPGDAIHLEAVLWNLAGVSCERLPAVVATSGLGPRACILTGARHAEEFSGYGRTLVVPTSVGRLLHECGSMAEAATVCA